MIASHQHLPSFLEFGFEQNDGGYFSRRISMGILPVEAVLIAWPPGSKAIPHDHGNVSSTCFVLPVNKNACLKAGFFSCEGGQIERFRSENLNAQSFHYVAPYQIHSVENDTSEWVLTLNLYYPPRY